MAVGRWEDTGVQFPIQAFTPGEAAEIRAALHRIAREEREKNRPSDVSPFDSESHPMIQMLIPWLQRPAFLSPIKFYLGDTILMRSVDVFCKPPASEGQAQIQWHWDDPTVGAEQDRVLTAWVALTPSTLASGCLQYLVGSHRAHLVRQDPLDRNTLQVTREDWEVLGRVKVLPAALQPGEMSLHHSAIIHGSGPNRTEMERLGLAVRLHAPDAPQTVTGTRMGILLAGQAEEEAHRWELRNVVAVYWWTGEEQAAEPMNAANRFNDAEAHATLRADLEKRAEGGDGAACVQIGRMMLVGMAGFSGSQKEAVSWFEKGAQAGDSWALELGSRLKKQERFKVLLPLREETEGLSVLAWCVYTGDADSVDVLLRAGTPLHMKMKDGRQALHVAVSQNLPGMVNQLVGWGALDRLGGPAGNTPLHWAVAQGKQEMTSLLIGLGHPVAVENERGEVPGDLNADPDLQRLLSSASHSD